MAHGIAELRPLRGTAVRTKPLLSSVSNGVEWACASIMHAVAWVHRGSCPLKQHTLLVDCCKVVQDVSLFCFVMSLIAHNLKAILQGHM
jgi:hypothetical protein